MFPQTVGQRDYIFHCLGAYGDGMLAVKRKVIGEEYEKVHSLSVKVFPADWKMYGRGAGPVRNRQMLKYACEEKPLIIDFWNGTSSGTKNMITQAEKAGADVRIVYL